MAELKELDVDRVDGVDHPATRRPFLLMKSEEDDETHVNLETLVDAVERALTALQKSMDGLDLTPEQAAALNTLAKMVGIEPRFAVSAAKPKKPEEEYGYPEPAKGKKKAEDSETGMMDIADEIARRVTEAMQAWLTSREQGAGGMTPPPSRQPAAQDNIAKSERELGRGLFTNIIFGGN